MSSDLLNPFLDRRYDELERLPLVSEEDLRRHKCFYCSNFILRRSTNHRFQTIPDTIDECLYSAHAGCKWYSYLLQFVKRSGKSSTELDNDRFEVEWLDDHQIRIWTGVPKSYTWPCVTFKLLGIKKNLSFLTAAYIEIRQPWLPT
jgi:hypothetical protein